MMPPSAQTGINGGGKELEARGRYQETDAASVTHASLQTLRHVDASCRYTESLQEARDEVRGQEAGC